MASLSEITPAASPGEEDTGNWLRIVKHAARALKMQEERGNRAPKSDDGDHETYFDEELPDPALASLLIPRDWVIANLQPEGMVERAIVQMHKSFKALLKAHGKLERKLECKVVHDKEHHQKEHEDFHLLMRAVAGVSVFFISIIFLTDLSLEPIHAQLSAASHAAG